MVRRIASPGIAKSFLTRAFQSNRSQSNQMALTPNFGDLRYRINDHFGRSLAQLAAFPQDPFAIADRLLSTVNDEFKMFNREMGGERATGRTDLSVWFPSTDVRESEDSFVFHCDLPGVKKEDIQVDLKSDRLTISGKREQIKKEESEKWQYSERSFGTFSRSFHVPAGTQKSDVSATYNDGVLEVKVKKAPPAVEDESKIMIE